MGNKEIVIPVIRCVVLLVSILIWLVLWRLIGSFIGQSNKVEHLENPVIQEELPSAVAKVDEPKELPPQREEYTATAYCPCKKCSGNWGKITATGTTAKEGRTVGVDPKVIPYGAEIEVAGMGTYIAEDTGVAIKGFKLDIYFDTHQKALNFGRQKVMVQIKGAEQ